MEMMLTGICAVASPVFLLPHRTRTCADCSFLQAPHSLHRNALLGMAFSLFRFGRFLRSIFSPAATFIGFSCLLTFYFLLYQPNAGPGAKQRVGWQAWEAVGETSVSGSNVNGSVDASTGAGTVGTPSQAEGTDWWNVTSQDTQNVDSASLPLDVWDPLLPHDTGCEWFYNLLPVVSAPGEWDAVQRLPSRAMHHHRHVQRNGSLYVVYGYDSLSLSDKT